MRLEDDPKVKTLPSQHMRNQLAEKVLRANMKLHTQKQDKGA